MAPAGSATGLGLDSDGGAVSCSDSFFFLTVSECFVLSGLLGVESRFFHYTLLLLGFPLAPLSLSSSSTSLSSIDCLDFPDSGFPLGLYGRLGGPCCSYRLSRSYRLRLRLGLVSFMGLPLCLCSSPPHGCIHL